MTKCRENTARAVVEATLNQFCWQTQNDIIRTVAKQSGGLYDYNVVNTVLDRMRREGLLIREFVNRRWRYIRP